MASSGEGPFAIASAIAACAFDFFLSLPRAGCSMRENIFVRTCAQQSTYTEGVEMCHFYLPFFTLSGIFPIDAAFCLAIFFWKSSICFVTSFAVFSLPALPRQDSY